jgi:nitroreductase/NAD-dependent dihydropyrimidine dehydrogenase PreA subunit
MIQENFIRIDQDKCVQCGLCVKVCRGTLGMGSNGPEIIKQLCIGCGHCVAVCPNEALNNVNAPKNQLKIEKLPLLDPDTTARFIRSRRSVRNYHQKTVNREIISQLLDIARYAPTACNSQGVSYHVVDDVDTLRRITGATVDWAEEEMRKGSTIAASPWAVNTAAQIESYRKSGTDVVLRNAPCLVVATASKDMMPLGRDNTYFSLSYVQLYAPSFGLGTCWSGLFEFCATANYEPMLRLLNLPENSCVTGGLMIGYPLYSFKRLVNRDSLIITWQ